MNGVEHEVYFEFNLGNILNLHNLKLKKYSGKTLRETFPWNEMKKLIVPPLHSYIGEVFDRNQNVQFYIIRKNVKLKKTQYTYLRR